MKTIKLIKSDDGVGDAKKTLWTVDFQLAETLAEAKSLEADREDAIVKAYNDARKVKGRADLAKVKDDERQAAADTYSMVWKRSSDPDAKAKTQTRNAIKAGLAAGKTVEEMQQELAALHAELLEAEADSEE